MSLPSLNIEIVVTYLRYDCEIISKSVSKNDFFLISSFVVVNLFTVVFGRPRTRVHRICALFSSIV